MTTRDEIEELKGATRAAHEVLKDLNKVIRAAETVTEELRTTIERESHRIVDEVLADETRKGMDQLVETIGKLTEEATKQVIKRFNVVDQQLAEMIAMGKSVGMGGPGETPPLVDANQINGMLVPGPAVQTTEYRYQNGHPLSRADRRRTKGKR